MPTSELTSWYHSNAYNAESACHDCGGIIRHEPWCVMESAEVSYAYEALQDSNKLTAQDRLILHALGVTWGSTASTGRYKPMTIEPDARPV